MKRILLFLFLLTSLFANAREELLPADKAFAFKAKVVNDKILLNWDIAKGYYLYKKKIKIVSDHSQRLGEAQFPAAKIKDDEFFGKVGIYRDNVLVSVPVLEGASKLIVVNVEFQGCADLGVCYPPITKSATLKVVSGNKSLIDSAFNVLSKTKSAMQSIVDKATPVSDEPLPADQAFSYSVSAIDANTLRASWKIHPEYYLYHDKFFIDVKGAEFGDVNFPKGEIKDDEFFGKIRVHTGEFSVDIPLTNIESLSVSFNGSLFVFVALGTDFGSVLTGLIVLPAVTSGNVISVLFSTGG
jgi:thiol:disulfide interchange protein DsbD